MRTAFLALALATLSADATAAIRGSVLTSAGNPVPSATVRLYPVESREMVLTRLRSEAIQPEAVADAVTDTRGNFSIDAPAGGSTWRLQIAKDGYAPAGAVVVADFDLAGVILRPAAMEQGRVRDGARPMADAVVRFADDDGTEWVARTDDEGRYRVPAPEGWATQVTVISPDGHVWNEVSARADLVTDRRLRRGEAISGKLVTSDGRTPAEGATIRLDGIVVGTSGEQGAFRVESPPAGWSLLEFATDKGWAVRTSGSRAALGTVSLGKRPTISGSVRAAGIALAGARVAAYPATAGVSFVSGVPRGEALADEKGRFAIEQLPPGRYRLRARHPLYRVDETVVDLPPGEAIDRHLAAVPLTLVSGHVLDDGGRPLAAAQVRPRLEGMGRFGIPRSPAGAAGGWSAADGRFVIRSIPPDSPVALEARKPGLPPGRTEPLKVASSEPLAGIRIVIPHGYELSGVVLDEEKNPIAGALVRAEETRTEGNRMIMIGGAADEGDGVRTDAQGRFTMRLAEGRWDVSAGGDEWSRSTKSGFEVSGDTDGLEFTLQPAVSIRGRVVRRGSGGIANADVRIMSREAGQRTAVTGPDGSFEISGLTPGTSMLIVDKSDEMLREMRMVTAPQDDLVIEIPPGSTLSGRVVDAETKAPVSAFTIAVGADRSGGGMVIRTPPIPRSFQTEDGSFVLQNVTSDPAELIVQAPGYVEKRVGGVEAPAGESRDGIEIGLSRGTIVTGKVTDPSGRPISGVRVSRDENSPFIGGPRMGGAGTDPEGRFEVGPFSGEMVALRFDKDGYRDERREVRLSGKSATVDVRLSRGAALTGQVVTDAGTPVAGAQVSVRGGGELRDQGEATTDSSGMFRIEGLGEGRVRVTASRSGYTTAVQDDVDLASSGSLRLVLGQGGTVTGRVRGLVAAEIPDASVEVRSGSSTQRAQLDGTGSFRVDGVAPGTARVSASVGRMGPRRTSPMANVEVGRGSEAYVELDMSSGYEISGVVRLDGAPAGDVMVSFAPADPVIHTRSSATSDSSGRYRVTGLEAGPYRVSAVRFGTGDVTWQGEFRVERDDRYDINVEGVMVRGRVVDGGTGRGVEGAALEIRRADGGVSIGGGPGPVSGPGGSFAFRNITPGRWIVRAAAEGMGSAAETIEVGSSGASIELRLSPSEGVVMRVVDAGTGTPLAAFVSVRDGAGRTVLTDLLRPRVDGSVTLPLSPGSYRVRVQSQGYAHRWITVSSPSPGITVPLSIGGTLSINVRGNEPLRARIIDLSSGEPLNGAPGGITALMQGSNVIQNVPAGQIRIELIDAGGAVMRSETLTIADRAVASLEL